MFTLFMRGAVLYLVMILVMRGLGKRQLGEFQPFELATQAHWQWQRHVTN